jgi:hypothetical protein
MAIFAIQRMYQRARPSEEDRSDFVAVSAATPSAFNLDPRADPSDEDSWTLQTIAIRLAVDAKSSAS